MSRKAYPGSLREALVHLSYLSRALLLTWEAAKGWTLFWMVLLLVQGLLPAATVYLTKFLVDSVAAAIGAGLSRETLIPVLIPAALMGSMLLLEQVLSGLMTWIRTAQSEHVTDHVKALIHEKAVAMDMAFYESPVYFDQMARATSEASSHSLSILQSMGGLLQNLITLIGISVLLLAYSIWLPLLLLVSTLPALVVVMRHNKRYHTWWEGTTEKRRWEKYYDMALTSNYAAPEIRSLNLSHHLRRAHDDLRRLLRERRLQLMGQQSRAQLFAGLAGLVVTGATMAWMVLRAIRGVASLGDLALFYQAFNQGQGLMRSLLGSLGQLYADALFMEHLFTLLELTPRVVAPAHPRPLPNTLRQGIRFRDVTFRYPGSESPALQHFNLTIPAGKMVAIVGPNGVGKSTLIKLLCRFYDPERGNVELDGVDIRNLCIEELRRNTTVMFQTPVQWIASAADNITYGDLRAGRDPEAIEKAARAAGARQIIERLAHGYDTLLSKQFEGGTELSGGQWQRIALARAFYRNAPIVILDEPTSFMDSWEETKWLDRFCKLVETRTTLIVTHRFTTAMRAHTIYVMNEGRIIESGSHEELLAQDGFYAASWKAQIQSGGNVPSSEPIAAVG